MYKVYEDYERYDAYDDSYTCVSTMDQHIASLIEELYSSKTLDKKAIAAALNGIVSEIQPERFYDEDAFKCRDISLSYHDTEEGFVQSFCTWLDCLDPITGDMDYDKLLKKSTQFEKKNLTIFMDIFSATTAIMNQLTTWVSFDEKLLGGALVYLATRYGVKHDDALYITPNVKRK